MPTARRAGNWFEENALEAYTGVEKFDVKNKKMGNLTKNRCIEHTERTDPKDYKSVQAECIQNPRLLPEFNLLQDKVGPRTAMLEASMRKTVETQFTETQAAAYTANRKVEYVSEYGRGYCARGDGESKDLPANYSPTSNYAIDNAISFYTDSVNRGTVGFPTTFATTTNPFRKSSAFSCDSRSEPTISKTESNERPRPMPTVKEFKIIRDFRDKLVGANVGEGQTSTDLEVIGPIIDFMWNLLTSETSTIVPLQDWTAAVEATYGVVPTREETYALLSAFDPYDKTSISIPDFTDFLGAVVVYPMDAEGRPTTSAESGRPNTSGMA